MSFLCEAYIIRKVNRYDIHGRRIFESNDKYYFEDPGIRNAVAGGTREGDIEKVWANPEKANKVLGWKAEVPLAETMKSAWNWQLRLRERGIM